MSKMFKLLVADDEPIDLKVITSALKDKYEVLSAHSGQEAIDLTKKHMPDMIVLDVLMPDLDGYEVCMTLKNDIRFADIPIVFVTAVNSKEGELRGLKLGGIDYICKPINFALLHMRIKNQLALKEQRDLIARQKEELEATLARIKQLEGIIPICMYCKNIRNDNEDWKRVEVYLSEHSNAQLSHGICPDCMKEHFPNRGKK